MLKVKNRNTRVRCKICSNLTIKTPERPHWHRSGDRIVNFAARSSVSIFDFEQVNAGCV